MLTDNQIKKLVKQKKIIIDPYDENQVMYGKYDVHLGPLLLIPKNVSEVIDPEKPACEFEKYDLTSGSFIFNPGQFILGQTLEFVGTNSDIGMFIDGRSTLARLGMTVHLSSAFIPPGQDPGIITLEMYNAGPWKIKLYYKVRVGKLIIFKYSEENKITSKSRNRYNGQSEVTGAKAK